MPSETHVLADAVLAWQFLHRKSLIGLFQFSQRSLHWPSGLSLKTEICKLPLLSVDLSLCSSFISATVKRYPDNIQHRREKGLFDS